MPGGGHLNAGMAPQNFNQTSVSPTIGGAGIQGIPIPIKIAPEKSPHGAFPVPESTDIPEEEGSPLPPVECEAPPAKAPPELPRGVPAL